MYIYFLKVQQTNKGRHPNDMSMTLQGNDKSLSSYSWQDGQTCSAPLVCNVPVAASQRLPPPPLAPLACRP